MHVVSCIFWKRPIQYISYPRFSSYCSILILLHWTRMSIASPIGPLLIPWWIEYGRSGARWLNSTSRWQYDYCLALYFRKCILEALREDIRTPAILMLLCWSDHIQRIDRDNFYNPYIDLGFPIWGNRHGNIDAFEMTATSWEILSKNHWAELLLHFWPTGILKDKWWSLI